MIVAGLTAALGACRSNTPPPAPVERPLPDERPADFVLAATVYSPDSMSEAKLPRSLRGARYVVEADGALRAATGEDLKNKTFPGQVRQLSPREFDTLWRVVRESGLLDPESAWRVENPEQITRAPDRTTVLIYIACDGRRTTLRLLLDRANPDSVAAERLVDRLAQWAWVRE
jgi:hypothetical protein